MPFIDDLNKAIADAMRKRDQLRLSALRMLKAALMNREVELLAVGGGPSNLALAVALEELAPDDLAAGSLIVERAPSIEWQPGHPDFDKQASYCTPVVATVHGRRVVLPRSASGSTARVSSAG